MQWSLLTFRPRNHIQFYVFEKNIGVRESQNSNSKNHKTEIFIDNVTFTLHPLVRLLPNSTTSKELTILPSLCLQKRALKLVLWLPEVEDFLFIPLWNIVFCYVSLSCFIPFCKLHLSFPERSVMQFNRRSLHSIPCLT